LQPSLAPLLINRKSITSNETANENYPSQQLNPSTSPTNYAPTSPIIHLLPHILLLSPPAPHSSPTPYAPPRRGDQEPCQQPDLSLLPLGPREKVSWRRARERFFLRVRGRGPIRG
ncbi:hypothetical protein CC80DRAFT_559369, partial [Byssothecium circinans]